MIVLRISRKCMRCGYSWKSHVSNPRACPYCKSPKWNVERKWFRKSRPGESKPITWEVDERGCWNCTSHWPNRRDGTVSKKFRGRLWSIPRIVWTEKNGEIPDQKRVLHRCKNSLCINPDHLFIRSPGTYRGKWDEV